MQLWLFAALAMVAIGCAARNGESPKAPRLPAEIRDVTFESEGETIVGRLHLPERDPGRRLPAVVLAGPWTQVKEQVGATYGPRLAAAGFAVLAFDPRHWGESGGTPRFLESNAAKATDIRRAVAFLGTLDEVDGERIGALGVCAGVGHVATAIAEEPRIRSFASISPWVQHPDTTPAFYGGPEGVADRIARSEQAWSTFRETGAMPTVPAYDPEDPAAAMFFPVDYYGNAARGAVPSWENRFAVGSWQEWLELDTIAMADAVRVPTMIVYGDRTFLPDNIRAFHERLSGPKSLELVDGEHTEFYDLTGPDSVRAAVDRVVEHFANTL